MKKFNSYAGVYLKKIISCKTFKLMKNTLLLMFITVLQVYASDTYSQNTKLSLALNNVTVADVLEEIQNKSEFYFLFNAKLVNVERKVTISVENEKISGILTSLFAGTEVNHVIYDRQIILTPSDITSLSEALQQIKITGTVTDEKRNPLPGVTVTIKSTTIGALSDASGKFTIDNAPQNAILIFSFVGMKTQEISASGKTSINVVMVEESIGLDEVVVIGYGTQKKKDITGSISSISQKDFADKPMSSVSQALVGRIPGLDVVSSGSGPGSSAVIRLRGRRSFVASNNPLVILDGVPYYGSINDINPYDIQSIDVLKDASSTAIYGSQGANGVILITTKRGQTGKAKFTIESYGGLTTHEKIPVYNGAEFAERGREAARMAGSYPDDGLIHDDLDKLIFTSSIEYDNMIAGNSVDYQDLLLQNGYQQKHQISVVGGSEAIKYNFSGNIYDEEGIIPTNKFNRYSLRSNLDFTLSPKFTIGTSVLLQYNLRSRKLNTSSLDEAVLQSPLGTPYNEDGTPNFDPNMDGYRIHPLADLEWDSYRYSDKGWDAFINVFADYHILPSLTYRLNIGADISLSKSASFAGPKSLSRRGNISSASLSDGESTRKTYESILTFNKAFGDHSLTVTGVHSILTSRSESSGLNVTSIPYETSLYYNVGTAENITGVNSGLTEQALISYVGRIFYGYKGKYLLTLTMRADGASQFAEKNKWGYFPSASMAWRISEEKFLSNVDWLSDLKLRLGYGITGNRGISPYQSQGGLSKTSYSWDESIPAFGYRPGELANIDLKWESTEVYNIGLDFAFLKGRIIGNVELYNTNTYDLLMYRNLPITTGFTRVLENVGRTNNKGLEIGLNTVNVERNDFLWKSNISFYLNREQIVELYSGKVDDVGSGWFIGQPISVYYDYKMLGIWQLDETADAAVYGAVPGQIKLLDAYEDQKITDADRMILGSQQPDFVLDLTNSLSYKNWDLSFDTYMRWGNMSSVPLNRDSFNRLNGLAIDYWTTTNPTNLFPRPDGRFQNYTYGGTLAYRDGSFIKLRQLTLGFTLPESLLEKVKISNARFYFTGDNLWYWTKTSLIKDFNMDPENSGNIERSPYVRTIIAGVNITF